MPLTGSLAGHASTLHVLLFQPAAGGVTTTPLAFTIITAIAGTAAILTFGNTVFKFARKKYVATVGLRRDTANRIAKLACGVRIAYVDSLLGEPMFSFSGQSKRILDGTFVKWEDRLYVLDHCFVQTRSKVDGEVAAISVTIRSEKFQPEVFFPQVGGRNPKEKFKLGKTSYLGAGTRPASIQTVQTPKYWDYIETFEPGNPGFYQTYILAYNRTGANVEFRSDLIPPKLVGDRLTTTTSISEFSQFRTESIPNTFITVGPNLSWEEFGEPRGPEYNALRVLPWLFGSK